MRSPVRVTGSASCSPDVPDPPRSAPAAVAAVRRRRSAPTPDRWISLGALEEASHQSRRAGRAARRMDRRPPLPRPRRPRPQPPPLGPRHRRQQPGGDHPDAASTTPEGPLRRPCGCSIATGRDDRATLVEPSPCAQPTGALRRRRRPTAGQQRTTPVGARPTKASGTSWELLPDTATWPAGICGEPPGRGRRAARAEQPSPAPSPPPTPICGGRRGRTLGTR